MIKVPVAAVLAISSFAALSACSSNDNGNYGGHPSRVSYASPQQPSLSPDMIQQVQSRLQQAGDYNGRIDGVWGPGTESGVRNYQRQHNLNPTGQLDGNTLAALNLGGARQTYGSTQPTVSTQPNDGRGNDVAPMNTDTPYSSATPLSPSTTR
jgi:peptidoglycan hydrolase-like protein with peptidoglycan-binding domain